MLGHPGSGKTCAQHLLLNEDPPYYVPVTNPSFSQDSTPGSSQIAGSTATTESTPIACKAVKALRISINDDETLQRVHSDELLLKLAADLKNEVEKALVALQKKEAGVVDYSVQSQEPGATADEESMVISNNEEAHTASNGIKDPKRNGDVSGIEEKTEKERDSFSESPEKKFKASLEESDILENISDLIPKAKAAKLSRDWVYIIDSGGQPAFQELLPLFTRAASLNLITLDISRDLDDEIAIEYRIKGKTFSYDQEPVHTNLQVFKSAVSSGAIYQSPLASLADHPKHSMFFVLGTHFDVFKGNYKKKIECKCKMKEMNERLISSFPSSTIKEFVIFFKKDSVIFPVNTLLEGAEREEASKDLFYAISRREEVSLKIKVPIRWFALELELEKKAEVRGFVSEEEAIEEGKRLKMTELDVKEALKYLHNCTIILYYPDVEPRLVFLKPQVIIDVLSHLLVLTYGDDKLVRLLAGSVTTKEINHIADHGKFRETLLKKFDKFTGEFQPTYFINLLNHLHIIVELPEDKMGEQTYFLPCALPPYHGSTFKIPASTIKPLRLLWRKKMSEHQSAETVSVPRGSFHLMIVHLLKQKKYTVLLSSQHQQYRNAVTLIVSFLPPREEKVYIVNHDNEYLEITYIGSRESCPDLLELVKAAIKESVAAINVSCGELCSAFTCLTEDGTSIVDEEGKPRICPDAQGHSSCTFTDDSYLCWFKNSKSQGIVPRFNLEIFVWGGMVSSRTMHGEYLVTCICICQ